MFSDATTLKARRASEIGGHEFPAMAFSPDRRTIATGHDQYTARLWSVATGRQQRYVQSEPSPRTRIRSASINGVAFDPSGRTLATAGADGKVSLWSAATGVRERVLIEDAQEMGAVQFSPDGRVLVASECPWHVGGIRPDWRYRRSTRGTCRAVCWLGLWMCRVPACPVWCSIPTATGSQRLPRQVSRFTTFRPVTSGCDWPRSVWKTGWLGHQTAAMPAPRGISTLAAVRSGTRAVPLSTIGPALTLPDLFRQVLR